MNITDEMMWGYSHLNWQKVVTRTNWKRLFVATLRELGKTMARNVVIGGKGAYGVNAEDTKYYLVELTADPRVIEEDSVIMVANQLMQVFTGDWACNGKCLNNVH
jgi:hypothetical protein